MYRYSALIFIGIIFFIIVIYLVLAYFLGIFPFNTRLNQCGATQLLTPSEAYSAYADGLIDSNPLYLISESATGPFGLAMKNIPKNPEDCLTCGSQNIPFPPICCVQGMDYIQSGQGAETRTYTNMSGDTITLGQNCIGEEISGVPVARA